MNLASATALTLRPETRTWFRALEAQYWPTALQTSQSATRASRFNGGPFIVTLFEVLYLAENHQVALFEVGALYGSPTQPGGIFSHPHVAWTIINVRVQLQQIADLTRMSEQRVLGTTAQELTGDWEGYQQRSPRTSVSEPIGVAPTQELGEALFAVPGLEGFRTVSARVPYAEALVLFPEKLLPGSSVEFSHPTLGSHVIQGLIP